MEKRINVSVIKLGQPQSQPNHWCGFLQVDSAELENHGRLYGVGEINTSAGFNASELGNLTFSALKNAYYEQTTASPLKSLENSLYQAQHELVESVFGPVVLKGVASETTLRYHFAALSIWGEFLAATRYGSSVVYLRRGGNWSTVEGGSGDKIFTASGMISDGDIVVLGSSNFCKALSYEDLTRTLDRGEALPFVGDSSVAFVIRFNIERLPSVKEALIIQKPNRVSESRGWFVNLLRRHGGNS